MANSAKRLERYTIFCRTAAGEALANNPKRMEERKLRELLLAIDGSKSLEMLERRFGPESDLMRAAAALIERGLIETNDVRIAREMKNGFGPATETVLEFRPERKANKTARKGEREAELPTAALRAHAEREPEHQSSALALVWRRLPWGRIVLWLLVLVLAGLVGLWWVAQGRGSDSNQPQFWLGQPIRYADRGLVFAPWPALELRQLQVGDGAAALRVDRLRVHPDLWVWLSGRTQRLRAEADGVSGSPSALARLGRIEGQSTWKITGLDFTRLSVPVGQGRLDLPAGELRFAEDGSLDAIQVQLDTEVSATAQPKGDALEVLVEGSDWTWAGLPMLKLQRVVAQGQLDDGTLRFTSLGGNLFDGAFNGSLGLSFAADKLTANLQLHLDNTDVVTALSRLAPGHTLHGRLSADLRMTASAGSVEQLAAAWATQGSYTIRQGNIDRFGLLEGLRRVGAGPAGGGLTRFERLSGNFSSRAGAETRVRVSRLDAGPLQAGGNFVVLPDGRLTGNFYGSLTTPAGEQITRSLVLGGKLDAPALSINP